MAMKLVVLYTLLCSLLPLALLHALTPFEWLHHVTLDSENHYTVRWLFSLPQQSITFDVCVRTRGWIGFGFSPNGGMTGSDLVIAWVDDHGRAHLQDRYAEDEEMPTTDSKQDWLLLSGQENETHTCVIFTRPFLTCDYETDLPITNDVTKLIWAYDFEDPVGSSAIISKHNIHRRGHKSVHLLSHKFEDSTLKGEVVQTWDITSSDLVLPNNTDTTYWCKIVIAPFVKKAHVIRIEPVISPPQNAPFVHHMVLYRCLHPEPDQMKQYKDHPGTNCFDFANMPFDFIHCQSIYMVWATGGDALNLPDNVGIPIAEDHETSYFLFEIHYDNPELLSISDSSGFRLFYTSNLRQYDADTATMGSVVDYRLIIPNGFENFTVSGHCSPECFAEKMHKSGMNVLAALPHGHKHLEKILVRHFRGRTELPYLAEENNYDFNFQDFQRFDEKRVILPGDQITVECTYNTESLERPMFGGLSTKEEMCMVFLVYYPRMKGVRTCLSGLTPQTVMKLSSVAQVESIDENDMNPTVVLPREHANERLSSYVLESDWTFANLTEHELTYLIRYAPQKSQCFWRQIEGIEGMEEITELITYPHIDRPYTKPKRKCVSSTLPYTQSSTFSSYSAAGAFLQVLPVLLLLTCFNSCTL